MGDETLERLLLVEMKVVFRYLLKIGATKEDAEDIVQDTLYKALKNIDSIQADKITAWLFKVAINSYYTLYNKNKKQSHVSIDEMEGLKLLSEGTEDHIVTEERKHDIREALNLLKPSYKNLLVLKYVLELSYRDLANILDLSEQQVKTYLYRARNQFKEIWEGLDNEQIRQQRSHK